MASEPQTAQEKALVAASTYPTARPRFFLLFLVALVCGCAAVKKDEEEETSEYLEICFDLCKRRSECPDSIAPDGEVCQDDCRWSEEQRIEEGCLDELLAWDTCHTHIPFDEFCEDPNSAPACEESDRALIQCRYGTDE